MQTKANLKLNLQLLRKLSLFFGSMPLAVAILAMLGIASVIGSILQQNQSYTDYVIKFGSFWFEFYKVLGLYNVYQSTWFISLLGFMLLSIVICIYRHFPVFVQDIKSFRMQVAQGFNPNSKNLVQFDLDGNSNATNNLAEKLTKLLNKNGYKTKVRYFNSDIKKNIKVSKDGKVHYESDFIIGAKKGLSNRIGYFFTHSSILILCFGGILDSSIVLHFYKKGTDLVAETKNIAVAKIDDNSKISANNTSFRGSVTIPEGRSSNVIFLPYKAGYLVQELPITVKVKDFNIKYYDTGMPKSFESQIELFDSDNNFHTEKTISVNDPLIYKDIAIYQSSFSDGGTKLNLQLLNLSSLDVGKHNYLQTAINSKDEISLENKEFTLEFNDFKLHNVVDNNQVNDIKINNNFGKSKKFFNNGPSLNFKLRAADGKAWEYINYYAPVKQRDRYYYISGVRQDIAEEFKYIFIPLNPDELEQDEKEDKGAISLFQDFLSVLNNPVLARKYITSSIKKAIKNATVQELEPQIKLLTNLLFLFRAQGFAGIDKFVASAVEKNKEQTRNLYRQNMGLAIQSGFLEFLADKHPKLLDSKHEPIPSVDKWFEDAVLAYNALNKYGPPLLVRIDSFEHIQATGLQITKSPGKLWVYFGSFLLIVGVYLLLYVAVYRVWIKREDNKIYLLGNSSKNKKIFLNQFKILQKDISLVITT